METPAVNAESAAATSLISTDPEWRKTGVIPEKPKAAPTPAAESSEPEVPAEAVTDSESAAAPEAAHQEKPKRNAETRIRELVAANKRLEAERDEARRGKSTPAEPSPAPPAEPAQQSAPKKPEHKDFDTYEKYEEAKDKYYEDLADYKAAKAIERAEFDRQQRETTRAMQEKLDDARKRYPDYDEKAIPFAQSLLTDKDVHGLIKARLDKSTVLADLMYVMAGDEEKSAAFLKLAKSDPLAALDELVLTEQLVKAELAKPGEKAPEKHAPKPPPPPPEVSGKGTPPGDEVESAKVASDGSPAAYRKYAEAANRRDIERAKGGRR